MHAKKTGHNIDNCEDLIQFTATKQDIEAGIIQNNDCSLKSIFLPSNYKPKEEKGNEKEAFSEKKRFFKKRFK